jgi:hypothetical protein
LSEGPRAARRRRASSRLADARMCFVNVRVFTRARHRHSGRAEPRRCRADATTSCVARL